jgi:CubicO group peptidase (beta-lactamase class C family)
VPTLVESLADSAEGVRQVAEAGSAYAYSGGGYEVLQLLIEDVTGRPFATYMRDEVLIPLGMRSSSFDVDALDQSRVATPFDSGRAIARHRYVGLAPAGLYSTAGDLARFVSAELRGPHGEPPGRGVLSPTSVAVMQTPAPGANQGFGFWYGLGHNLFPLGDAFGPLKILGDGAVVPGHMGQNTGWGAVIWMNPGTGDGFVMLTNHSSGYNAYRWALCDWVRWTATPSFGRTCTARRKQPMGPMGTRLYASEEVHAASRLPFVDSLARRHTTDSTPGVAILVMRDDQVVHSAGYGVADLATGAPITASTPFYLASMSKEFTALAILRLAANGRLSLSDPLSRFLPEIGAPAGSVTIRQLLTHSSGVPDYYSFIRDWARLTHLNNAAVVDTLRGKPLRFPPGSSTEYSNSGYVLLAQVIARLTKHTFNEAMAASVFEPADMRSTIALDDGVPYPRGRAIGYDTSGSRYVMSDYGAFENGKGHRTYSDLRTVGAGGLYSTLDDLAAWERWLEAPANEKLVSASTRVQQRPDDVSGVDSVSGYGYGWIVSRRFGTDVVWHDGGFAGFHNIILRVPSRRFAVVVLSNSPMIEQHALALAIADHYLK